MCYTSFYRVHQRFRCDKKKDTEIIGNNAMCWEGEQFVKKPVPRYAHANPMGFSQRHKSALENEKNIPCKAVGGCINIGAYIQTERVFI